MRRREFVASIGACGAWVAAALATGTSAVRSAFAGLPGGRVVAKEPWGRLEEIAEGMWALISTPLVDHPRAHLTVANGGIVAGRSGVALVEGLVSVEGARWLASAALELTGSRPDHIVLTHHHGDHSTGLSAWAADTADGPILHASRTTLDILRRAAEERDREPPTAGFTGERLRLVDEDDGASSRIDLGDRRLVIHPASGHTDSDLFLTFEDVPITWCGDLVWNGMFPNYMDAIPSRLSRSVRRLAAEPAEIWVPGHGELADRAALERYVALIDDVEEAARAAFEAGRPPEEAAGEYGPPASLGEWTLFSPRYYETAFRAWHRELADSRDGEAR